MNGAEDDLVGKPLKTALGLVTRNTAVALVGIMTRRRLFLFFIPSRHKEPFSMSGVTVT